MEELIEVYITLYLFLRFTTIVPKRYSRNDRKDSLKSCIV